MWAKFNWELSSRGGEIRSYGVSLGEGLNHH